MLQLDLVVGADDAQVPGFPVGSAPPEVLEQTGWAAPTVTTDGRYVAAIFATGELVGVDMEGKRLWGRHLGVPRNHYGHASSLMSHQGLLPRGREQTRFV